MTYIHYGIDRWCYCFNVIDVFTREWIACIFDTVSTAHTAVQSVLKSVSSVNDISYLRLNWQRYTVQQSQVQEIHAYMGIRHEFIWKHTSEQNGHVESFYKTLKKEYLWRHKFASYQETEKILADAFAGYNQERIIRP